MGKDNNVVSSKKTIKTKECETMDKRPIGVMDSGLGGLSVARILQEKLPHESLVFVGDQGHFPYGTRTPSDIQQLALAIGRFLVTQDVKMMVVACNTATATALPNLQAAIPIPVIGMIVPGVKAALAQQKHARIGVIATTATINDGAYVKEIKHQSPATTVITKATQPLVSIVEHHLTGTKQAQAAVDEQLASFKTAKVDTLILGCTHFPFLAPEIHQTLGAVPLVDPAVEVVATVKKQLTQQDQLNPTGGELTLYTTGEITDLKQGADQWLAPAPMTYHQLKLGGR